MPASFFVCFGFVFPLVRTGPRASRVPHMLHAKPGPAPYILNKKAVVMAGMRPSYAKYAAHTLPMWPSTLRLGLAVRSHFPVAWTALVFPAQL